ncbi:S8 family serine peptidase [Streptomyces sp. NPDC051020]|uniref:S8 family serine peptidase n=1 Tax=Streptomyces sp. NPDC051020 TaxID=3155409 RepID=UPI00344030BC
MYRHSISAACALLLVSLILPSDLAHADSDELSGPSVTRIVTLDSAPAAQQAAPQDRAAARRMVSDTQRTLVDAAHDAGMTLSVRRQYRNVVNGLLVEVPAGQTGRLAELPGVAEVTEPVTYEMPERPTPVPKDVLAKAVDQVGHDARSGDAAPSGREIVTATDLTGVPQAHRRGYTGKGVTVGIIDSGIAYDHPALGGGGFPNAKVVGGYDFADEDADPYDDKFGPAAGHGTHVAGIVAGEDTHIEGVAPDATLRSYRVFGTKNAPTDAIVLAALDRAAADGVDVVNMSLGSTGNRSSSVLSLSVNHLVDSGVPTVVANGNGYAGPFNAAAPAVADGAIAVGSTYSSRYPFLAFTLDDGATAPVPYLDSGRAPAAPVTGTHPVAVMESSCAPLPAGSLDGKIALFAPYTGTDVFNCRVMDLARTAEAAGAVAAVHYDPSGTDPDAMPFSPCCDTIGIPVVGIRARDAERTKAAPAGTELTWGAYAGAPLTADAAGLMDAVRQRYLQLQLSSRHAIDTFVTGDVQVVGPENTEEPTVLSRGLQVRAVIDQSFLGEPSAADNVDESLARGMRIRTVDGVPLKLIVCDGEVAMLPLRGSGSEVDPSLVLRGGLANVAQALFDAVWERARPYGEPHHGIDALDTRILRLLLAGLTDHAVAAQVDLSARTVQRRIQGLMSQAGATTRIQLGWYARHHGWA